ncbi:MAG: T9SS type A sorting domain-containing protein [Flavobacteriaceae bacterium]|nr:T9SS type A sorting domain-containing protein [Flavobacteriaceae bacterium]
MKQFYFFTFLCLCLNFGFAQVTQVLDINDGSNNSNPRNLYIFNGNIYFNADDSSGVNSGGSDLGQELWITDGTAVGTSLLKDIQIGSSNSSPFAFFELGSTLYFSANDGGGSRIWQTDGTEAGTINTNNGFSNLQPIIVGSKAYMTATTLGNVFYEFDGTTFQQVTDVGNCTATPIGGIYIEFDPNTILIYMDYSTDEPTIGRELYKYDIAAQTYTLVKDVDTGTGDSSINYMAKINSTVYFEADNALWQTDGTEMGTILVSVVDAAGIGSVTEFYVWNGNLYFEGDDGNGDQLWKYDPIADTVTNLSNLTGTNTNHDPSDYAEYNGWLYYRGEDANDTDGHLFRTNGTTVEQIDSTIKDIDDIVVFNNKLYFEGDDGTTGNELYSFDDATLSITSLDLNNIVKVYPNPSRGTINIKTNNQIDLDYTIYDINGRQILNGVLLNDQIQHQLASGMYVLKLRSENSITVSKKIIVE